MFEPEFYNRPLDVQLQLIAGSLCYREHYTEHLNTNNVYNLERMTLLIEIIYLKQLRKNLIEKNQPSHSIQNVVVA